MGLNPKIEELHALVSSIPRGQVASYGQVGKAMKQPVSGLIVGRWLGRMVGTDEVPWWRVVSSQGEFVIAKRHPSYAQEQVERLTGEGIELTDGRVPPSYFCDL